MKYQPTILSVLALSAVLTGSFFGGCGQKTQRTPTLTKVPDTLDRPPQKGFLQKAGDTTWDVVSAPVRLVTPQKKRPVQPIVEEPAGPVNVIILKPGGERWIPEQAVAEKTPEPAATQPK
jgi:hypothetical protein